MEYRELLDRIKKGEKFSIPKINKIVEITGITQRNGRNFAHCVTTDEKSLDIDIRIIEPEHIEPNLNQPIPFPEENREYLEAREQKTFEALRLLGRNKGAIRRILNTEMKTAMEKTMMTKVTHSRKKENGIPYSTVRTKHYANAAIIAYQIAMGIFNDEDLARGVAICTLYHDFGQDPFGHDGEQAAKKASKNYNGGPRPHNSDGARRLYFREYDRIKYAINAGNIIEEEARKRVKEEMQAQEVEDKNEFWKRVKKKEKELEERIDLRLEPELLERINTITKENGELTDEAVKLIIMSAGNHNGERGTANITPDYSITFEEFWKDIERTYIEEEANNQLPVCTIADAIAKLADQISSIPFDMIDGVRSGLEDEISDEWIEPVSQILQIPECEVKKKLKGNNQELTRVALELQDKLVDSVVRCSNARKLDMDLAEWLYGLNQKVGLRTPNITEHIYFSTPVEEEVLLDNLVIDLTEKLSEEIVDERGIFYPNINKIFRMSKTNNKRESKVSELRREFKGDENIRDFYNYCTEITSEEYDFYKRIVKHKEASYFKTIIVDALKSTETSYSIPRSRRGTMKYAVETALAGGIERIYPDQKGEYSQEQIKVMMDNINSFLRDQPVAGIDNLNVTAPKTRYGIGKKFIEEREIRTDKQIAAEMAISYLLTLNDTQLLELGVKLGAICEEDRQKFYRPYEKISEKRNGGQGHATASACIAAGDYKAGNASASMNYQKNTNKGGRE